MIRRAVYIASVCLAVIALSVLALGLLIAAETALHIAVVLYIAGIAALVAIATALALYRSVEKRYHKAL
ncbi:MAG: hypothetical protein ACYCU8_00855 [Ferrimicrobium acidiphilum]